MARILLVDDDAENCEVVSKYLDFLGHRTACAADGQKALEWLLLDRADLVVLDVRMPNLDGVELLEIMRSYPQWREVPVILLTGLATQEDTRRARELGVTYIFNKPLVSLEDLRVAIGDCLTTASAN